MSAGKTSPNRRGFLEVRKPPWLALLVLVGIGLGMFADVLLSPQAIVLSHQGHDGDALFLASREFGFGELRQGNLPLWNPHMLSGYPYFGGFQSALLYPPNLMYLILPLDKAFNLDFVLHILLAGLFMYAWAAFRGFSPLARLTSATLLMFGAPLFFHIYPGHLTPIAVMAWSPLWFLVCDGLARRPSLGWCLLGTLAVAMPILAGYPQYFFYTFVAAGLYGLPTLLMSAQRVRALAAAAAIGVAGAALAAVQLAAGMQTAGESVRGDEGLDYSIASSFSFPPESFLTLAAPNFFGDLTSFPYWGRWYLWEMSLFMGITGLVLALCGVWLGFQRDRRTTVIAVSVLAAVLVLAAGAHTPLFPILYEYVPGFNKFRANAKFIYLASILLALLAGYGLDCLIRFPRRARVVAALVLIAAVAALAAAAWIYNSAAAGPASAWGKMVSAVPATGQSYLDADIYTNPDFIQQAGTQAAKSLSIACAVGVGLSMILALFRWRPRPAVYALVSLAILEVVIWSWQNRATFELTNTPPPFETFFREQPGDYRTVNPDRTYNAMSVHGREIGGYDPCVTMRYAEFMCFTQAVDPDQATAYLHFAGYHPLYSILRCRFAVVHKDNRWQLAEFPKILPHVTLIQDYQVISGRDEIFKAMAHVEFDPHTQVILEQDPQPQPEKSDEQGTVRIVDSSTDHLSLEAELPHPAILLITDGYSEGWRAVSLPGSVQQEYQLLPADYILRAIPLAAGKHRLRVVYSPLAFRVGAYVSISALILYVIGLAWYLRRWHVGSSARRRPSGREVQTARVVRRKKPGRV